MTFSSTLLAQLAEVIRQRTYRFLPGAEVQSWTDPMTDHHCIVYRIPREALFDVVDRFGNSRALEGALLSSPADAAQFIKDARKRRNAMAIGKFRLKRLQRRP